MQQAAGFGLLNSSAALPAGFHARALPPPLADARLAGDYRERDRPRVPLSRPCDEQPDMADHASGPPDWGRNLIVSCPA